MVRSGLPSDGRTWTRTDTSHTLDRPLRDMASFDSPGEGLYYGRERVASSLSSRFLGSSSQGQELSRDEYLTRMDRRKQALGESEKPVGEYSGRSGRSYFDAHSGVEQEALYEYESHTTSGTIKRMPISFSDLSRKTSPGSWRFSPVMTKQKNMSDRSWGRTEPVGLHRRSPSLPENFSPRMLNPRRSCSPRMRSPNRSCSPRMRSPRRYCSPRMRSPKRSSSPRMRSPRRSCSPWTRSPKRSYSSKRMSPDRSYSFRRMSPERSYSSRNESSETSSFNRIKSFERSYGDRMNPKRTYSPNRDEYTTGRYSPAEVRSFSPSRLGPARVGSRALSPSRLGPRQASSYDDRFDEVPDLNSAFFQSRRAAPDGYDQSSSSLTKSRKAFDRLGPMPTPPRRPRPLLEIPTSLPPAAPTIHLSFKILNEPLFDFKDDSHTLAVQLIRKEFEDLRSNGILLVVLGQRSAALLTKLVGELRKFYPKESVLGVIDDQNDTWGSLSVRDESAVFPPETKLLISNGFIPMQNSNLGRIVALDLPGMKYSTKWGSSKERTETLMKMWCKYLDALNVHEITIFVHSQKVKMLHTIKTWLESPAGREVATSKFVTDGHMLEIVKCLVDPIKHSGVALESSAMYALVNDSSLANIRNMNDQKTDELIVVMLGGRVDQLVTNVCTYFKTKFGKNVVLGVKDLIEDTWQSLEIRNPIVIDEQCKIMITNGFVPFNGRTVSAVLAVGLPDNKDTSEEWLSRLMNQYQVYMHTLSLHGSGYEAPLKLFINVRDFKLMKALQVWHETVGHSWAQCMYQFDQSVKAVEQQESHEKKVSLVKKSGDSAVKESQDGKQGKNSVASKVREGPTKELGDATSVPLQTVEEQAYVMDENTIQKFSATRHRLDFVLKSVTFFKKLEGWFQPTVELLDEISAAVVHRSVVRNVGGKKLIVVVVAFNKDKRVPLMVAEKLDSDLASTGAKGKVFLALDEPSDTWRTLRVRQPIVPPPEATVVVTNGLVPIRGGRDVVSIYLIGVHNPIKAQLPRAHKLLNAFCRFLDAVIVESSGRKSRNDLWSEVWLSGSWDERSSVMTWYQNAGKHQVYSKAALELAQKTGQEDLRTILKRSAEEGRDVATKKPKREDAIEDEEEYDGLGVDEEAAPDDDIEGFVVLDSA